MQVLRPPAHAARVPSSAPTNTYADVIGAAATPVLPKPPAAPPVIAPVQPVGARGKLVPLLLVLTTVVIVAIGSVLLIIR